MLCVRWRGGGGTGGHNGEIADNLLDSDAEIYVCITCAQTEHKKIKFYSMSTAKISVARVTTVMTRAENLQRRVATTARMLATYSIAMVNIN